ncbi:MAG: Uma2 family endonuclease [Steroidobacteraceae bacterium]
MIAVMPEDPFSRHRVTVEEYYRMARVGLLPPEMRVELIEGEVIDMLPVGEHHQGVVDRLAERLILAAAKRVTVRQQGPVRFDRYTELQPDFALLKRGEGSVSPPGAEEVLLLIEVSDSSLRYDRQVKLPLYAQHGIPEVWIIDVAGGAMHAFDSPMREGYTNRSTISAPGTRAVKAFPEMELDLRGLLPSLSGIGERITTTRPEP